MTETQGVKSEKSVSNGLAETLAKALGLLWPLLFSALVLLLTEWIHRGSLGEARAAYADPYKNGYRLAYCFLLFSYWLVLALFRRHWPATLFTGALGCLPATVCYFELKLRGEPFLPWDLTQAAEAGQVAGQAGLIWQASMRVSLALVLVCTLAAFFLPKPHPGLKAYLARLALAAALLGGLVFGVCLQPTRTLALEIIPDEWLQTRYYKNYGVITGFLTNLQNLEIDAPGGYGEEAVAALKKELQTTARPHTRYPGSYAATGDGTVATPNIIYVMDESFWDVSRLAEYGVVFDRDLCPNLHRLQRTSAWGRVYSPSFGGGTCDVEFEALTGHSCAYLPTGCKPYQQHVTEPTFSTPSYLKETFGYQTLAIHGYYKKFWNRYRAYPNLGLDAFIGLEDMRAPERKRPTEWPKGLVTDAEMARQIISAYEDRQAGAPLFLHAVTMQNHTSYTAANYPDEERVHILEAPEGMSAETIGALEDFAIGCWEADAMLGALTDYFASVDEPVVLAFWGDHYNPIGSGYEVYTSTGYAEGDSADPALHQTDLLIWSNYDEGCVPLGTIGAYELSPVLMDLYGIKKPLYYEYLTRQLGVYRSCSQGTMLDAAGQVCSNMSEKQTRWYQNHWLLEYDLLFGEGYLTREG